MVNPTRDPPGDLERNRGARPVPLRRELYRERSPRPEPAGTATRFDHRHTYWDTRLANLAAFRYKRECLIDVAGDFHRTPATSNPESGLLVKPSLTNESGRGTHWRELESSRLLRQMLFSHSRSD
jgi:hypothetical protein